MLYDSAKRLFRIRFVPGFCCGLSSSKSSFFWTFPLRRMGRGRALIMSSLGDCFSGAFFFFGSPFHTPLFLSKNVTTKFGPPRKPQGWPLPSLSFSSPPFSPPLTTQYPRGSDRRILFGKFVNREQRRLFLSSPVLSLSVTSRSRACIFAGTRCSSGLRDQYKDNGRFPQGQLRPWQAWFFGFNLAEFPRKGREEVATCRRAK